MIKTGTRPGVYECSPLRAQDPDTLARHLAWARAMCLKSWNLGYVPIAPHLYFPQFLGDQDPRARAAGLAAGLDLLLTASEVFALKVPLSEGMARELEAAERHRIPVRHWSLDDLRTELAWLPSPPPSVPGPNPIAPPTERR